MGVSYYAVSGLGVLIDFSRIEWPVIVVESCDHEERHGQAFCPKCGVKVGQKHVEDHDLRDVINETFDSDISKLRSAGYIYTSMGYEGSVYFLGWGKSVSFYGSDDIKKFVPEAKIPSFEDIKATIDKFVSETLASCIEDENYDTKVEIDIYDPKTFGFHSTMLAS